MKAPSTAADLILHNGLVTTLDRSNPIATAVGALSIVVPQYGRAGVRGGGVAVYRLDARSWKRLGDHAQHELLVFESYGPS